MIKVSPEITTIIMIGGILLGIFTGYPIAFVFGTVGLVVGSAVWGLRAIDVIYSRMYGMMMEYILLAVPLFVFMGVMLERSGIAEKLYDALYLWLSGLRGGLAIVTVLVGTILATTVGVIAASITMLALVALPSMIRRGYSKGLASGSVVAGGCLGILIPPSVMLVIYGPTAGVSVGKLFMGAFFPGFTLSVLYCVYIAVVSLLHPDVAPAVPVEERQVSFRKKTGMLVIALGPVAILIMSVLGVIYLGIAPPTEAAGVGAFAATILTVAYRRFSFGVLKEVLRITMRTCGFIFLIITMAVSFTSVFLGAGSGDVVKKLILSAPGGHWGIFTVIMLIIFILGMFIEWIGIVLIMVPIITPVAAALGFDLVWFSIMVCVNLQTAFMTPPVAGAIFICRGACPSELGVTMGDIIRGVTPFVVLILIGLLLLVAFPEIITWLPGKMVK